MLGTLAEGGDLATERAEAALGEVLRGAATAAQIAGFIVALRQKGETVEELTGLVRAMLDAAEPLDLPPGCIDIVGAGGSPARRRAALNISTMACFVAASAGAVVCKHGNRKASSTSGSFDVLEAMGVTIDIGPADVERCVRDVGIGFAFARTHHPAMRFAGPVRAEVGIPTVFNILGPLSHPGRLTRQVIGVADTATADLMVQVLANNGSTDAIVVTGDRELDEFSLSGPSRMLHLADGAVTEHQVDPTDLGLATATEADLAGGDAATNAAIAAGIFAGTDTGPRRDIVALNAAAGLVVAGVAADLAEGVERSLQVLAEGAPAAKLAELIAATRGN